jgi:hypothetical protein
MATPAWATGPPTARWPAAVPRALARSALAEAAVLALYSLPVLGLAVRWFSRTD